MKKVILILLSIIVIFLIVENNSDKRNIQEPITNEEEVIHEETNEIAEDKLTIVDVEIINRDREGGNGDVEIILSNGETKVVAVSDDATEVEDIYFIETYVDGTISPNDKFLAIHGYGFEDALVKIYSVDTDQLYEKTYGEVTEWTDDNRLRINSCDLSGEDCVQYISVSSETPWIFQAE